MWSHEEALGWLYGTQQFGIKLGLGNMRTLLAAIDLEELPFASIHVAGTNGKGSVCSMIERILREAHQITGLFTSPHLVSFEERIQVRGAMISREATSIDLAELKVVAESLEPHPTFFEITFALAMKHFAASGVECAVLETGMGGRLDATNVVTPRVSVITPVALDHQQWLGDTLAQIAGEKAGIIKPGVPVVSSPQHPEVESVLRDTAERMGSSLDVVESVWPGKVGLAGPHQHWNAAVAAEAVQACGFEAVEPSHVRDGVAAAVWPGRFQPMDWKARTFVIDGAHNPAASEALAETWRVIFGKESNAIILFGATESKDVAGVLKPLLALGLRWVMVPLESSRGIPPAELKTAVIELGVSPEDVLCVESVDEGLALLPPGKTSLVCGSLFLAGQVLNAISSDDRSGFVPSLQ